MMVDAVTNINRKVLAVFQKHHYEIPQSKVLLIQRCVDDMILYFSAHTYD